MKRLSIPEILESLEGKSQEEKIKILRSNDTRSLRQILFLAFSKDVKFNLPDSRPEGVKIEDTPVGLSTNTLYKQARKLRIFVEGTGYDHLTPIKRENIFIEILESVHKSEAELLLQLLIDRDLKTSLEYEDVRLAYHGLLPQLVDSSKPKKESKPKPKPVIKEEPKPEPKAEESKEEEVEELEDRIEDLEEALEDLKSDLEEMTEEEPKVEEPKVEESKEEPETYKNLSEVYEKNKKVKTKKKSSKKKSK